MSGFDRPALLWTDTPAAERAADAPTLIEVYRRPASAAMDHAGIPASWTRGNRPHTMSQSTEGQLFNRPPRVDDSIGLLREIEKSFAPNCHDRCGSLTTELSRPEPETPVRVDYNRR
jgi:hypothetical protein